ncbi:cathepsin L [Dermatophagoides farinae]|uniref:cathepsin L n=1 Tax=Dermatophagoides farinae TaxID=6954 RepID=UPI003F5D8630
MFLKYSLLLLFTIIITFINCLSYRELFQQEWNTYKDYHRKSYDANEDEFRFRVFMENKHLIAKHNQKAARGEKNYTLSLNEFVDLMHHEFVHIMNGYKYDPSRQTKNGASLFLSPHNIQVPSEVDWRKHNLVTPVKNQGHCGSCWSFSATGSLEGQHARKSGHLVSLSEQNLVDCSAKYGNNGCNGGLMDYAFQYIESNHGIDTEKSYPYEGKVGKCRYTQRAVGATDTGFMDVPQGDEQKLKEAVATVGPVSVAIDASQPTFQFYDGGVYDEPECSSTELDHGVLVVGYGVDEQSGQEYWLVKNSWGIGWGLNGFIKMARNKNNQCGIATAASYPLV